MDSDTRLLAGGINMAYLPNVTAGEHLDNQCWECLHGMNDRIMCPVYFAQINYNYTQCSPGNSDLREVLNCLINEKGDCQMKTVIQQAGITFDFSARDQLGLDL